jgi:hypothetical protein
VRRKNGEETKIICRDAPLERLLSIYQSLERQGFLGITKNIFAGIPGILLLSD